MKIVKEPTYKKDIVDSLGRFDERQNGFSRGRVDPSRSKYDRMHDRSVENIHRKVPGKTVLDHALWVSARTVDYVLRQTQMAREGTALFNQNLKLESCNPGEMSRIIKRVARWLGADRVGIAEVLTLPYACRKTGATSINVSRLLGVLGLGAFPGKNIDWIFPIFQAIYPSSFKMSNGLEVGICNANIILHPAPTLLSLGRIEYSQGDFYLYKEGFTPSIEKVIDALDREIASIFKALGFPSKSSKEIFEKRYEKSWDEQFNMMRKIGSKGPFDVKTRYITEDVPVGMVLISSIGKMLGIPTPTFDSVIHLCGVVNDENYWRSGRTLVTLGLEGMNSETLKGFLREGYDYLAKDL